MNKLYLAVDGPRADKSGEAEKCKAVQDCVKLIDWPCEIKTLFQAKNLGCKYGPYSAINWFFENEDAGIILEDDIRPSLAFLYFATEMLKRYKGDDRIGLVSGFNPYDLQSDLEASYHFSFRANIWGWATWRRVWKQYDVELQKYCGRVDDIIAKSKRLPLQRRIWRRSINEAYNSSSVWDVQFSVMCVAEEYLSIVPKVKLVANVGCNDPYATHTGGYIYWQKDWSKAGSIDFPLVHPKDVVCDDAADRLRERIDGAIFPRGLTWIGAKVPCLCGLMTFVGRIAEKVAPFLFRW